MISVNDAPNNADKDVVVPSDDASRAFVRGLVERKEAIVQTGSEPLPPKVTHVIVGKTEAGDPVVKRVRFSSF